MHTSLQSWDGVSAELADFAVNTGRDQLLPGVEAAKTGLLDYVASCFAGLQQDDGCRAAASVHRLFGRGPYCAPYSSTPTTAEGAAWLGAYLGHCADFDDLMWSMLGHPTVAVLPALLAVAQEELNVTGLEFIEAYILGVDIAARLGELANPKHYDAGWHATATLGGIAAAGAVCRLRRMSVETTVHALRLAAVSSFGLKNNFGSTGKPLQVANACGGAVRAATLAQIGFTAGATLEGDAGFFSLTQSSQFSSRDLSIRRGNVPAIVEPGLMHKVYPCCGRLSTTINLVLDLKHRSALPQAEDVEHISVTVDPSTRKVLPIDIPDRGAEAKFSLPWAIASTWLLGAPTLEHFMDSALTRSSVLHLAKRIRIEVAEYLPVGKLLLHIADATEVHEHYYEYEDREVRSYADITMKLRAVTAGSRLYSSQADALEAVIRTLDTTEDISVLSRHLHG